MKTTSRSSMRSSSKRGGITNRCWKLQCLNLHSPSTVVKASHSITLMVATRSKVHLPSKALVATIPLVRTALHQVRFIPWKISVYSQRQTLARQSHSIHLKMGRNRSHMPAKHRHPSSSNHSIQPRILATEYHPVTKVRHHQIPIPTAHNQPTTTHKNSPHLPTQAPQIPGLNHTQLISNNRSPRASMHPRFTLLQTASRMGKGSNHSHHTPANKLHILTLPWALPLHKTITQRITKPHLHNHLLKHHLLAWVRTHIQSLIRERLRVGIRHITLHRRNSSRGMLLVLLRRKEIRMISTGN